MRERSENPGEMTGEMSVGIETLENEDQPYWPSGNNATYKEVWLTPAGRWLSVMAEVYPGIKKRPTICGDKKETVTLSDESDSLFLLLVVGHGAEYNDIVNIMTGI